MTKHKNKNKKKVILSTQKKPGIHFFAIFLYIISDYFLGLFLLFLGVGGILPMD
jgi:hypothetical protein